MIGKTIGHYRILEPLGAGGMGTVYRARHEALSTRVVAIKVLSDLVVDRPDVRARFLREAEIMASLRHPNIVTLFDFLFDERCCAIVMELVEGTTLDRFAAGTLSLENAAPLFRQILAGLGHAHARGIVHRDVKPANVLVTPEGVVKLSDFGIARIADSAGLTRTGFGIGTPQYMSPEQVQGRREIGPASDLYSCGVLFHELLVGRLPFDASPDELFTILQAHVQTPAPPLRTLGVGVPVAVEAAILRALAKDPDERWPSCEAFAAALGVAEPASAIVSDESTPRWRLPALVAAGALVGASALLFSLRGGGPSLAPLEPASTRAPAPVAMPSEAIPAAPPATPSAHSENRALELALARAEGLLEAGDPRRAQDALRALRRVHPAEPRIPELEARARRAVAAKAAVLAAEGNALLAKGRLEPAIEKFEQALRLEPGQAAATSGLSSARTREDNVRRAWSEAQGSPIEIEEAPK